MIFALKTISLSFDKKVLFKNLSLTFTGPKIIGILGASGCGKSTLIRLLAGLQKPDSGEITRPLLKQGFIFQESHLLNWRTTFENVNLPFELQKISNPQAVQKSLTAVGLADAATLYPSQLSGGMKMRTSLARAFVTEPEILFCDEPFAALDEVTRENLQKDLRARVAQNEGLCFFVTHNLSEALNVADEIYYFTAPGIVETKPFVVNRDKISNAVEQNPADQISQLRTLVRGSFK